MPVEIRAATDDEVPALIEAMEHGFHQAAPDDDTSLRATGEMDRSRCAFDGTQMVGSLGAYSLDMTLPGGRTACGGTTWVTVRPTHRRRGILRGMMHAHLEEVRARGEVIAALWASESSIYGRFGYGPAAVQNRIEIEPKYGAFRDDVASGGTIRLLTVEQARELLPPVYDEACAVRPGHFTRSASWWEHRNTFDPPAMRGGLTPLRHALYERDGVGLGYLQYRARGDWSDDTGLARGTLYVQELQAIEPTARAALWRYALDVDLVTRVQAWNQPTDDPLPWLLADPRRAVRRLRDGLWVRVMDVAGALSARRFATEGKLTFEVADEFCPWNAGTYTLEGGPDGATCSRSSSEPDLRLDVADLGAVYLGGHDFRSLRAAGRIDGDPTVVLRADAMFRWSAAPWCPEIF